MQQPYIEYSFSNKGIFKQVTHYNAPVEKVVLRSPRMGNYFKTQHLHETKVLPSDNDDGVVIELTFIPNPELISLIMMYGGDAVALRP
jgi:hypothetical protein